MTRPPIIASGLVAVAVVAVGLSLFLPHGKDAGRGSSAFSSPAIMVPALPDDKREAFEEESRKQTEVVAKETLPVNATIVARADFRGVKDIVKGAAIVLQAGNQTVLRFENLLLNPMPALTVSLSTDPQGTDRLELGALRATKGSLNYRLPTAGDTDGRAFVLLRSETYNVLVAYAQLKPVSRP